MRRIEKENKSKLVLHILPSWFIEHGFFLLLGSIFYIYTCSPSIGSGDAALLIDSVMNLTLGSYVNIHNITIILGWLFSRLPIGDLAYRINLMSACIGGLTTALFYLTLFSHFRSKTVAGVATLFLMVSNSMWWNSTISEVYAVNALFTAIMLNLYCRLYQTKLNKYLYYIFFVAGLSIFNHVQMGFVFIGCAFYLISLLFSSQRQNFIKTFLKSLVAFFIGFLPFFLTFIRDVSLTKSFWLTLRGALGGNFQKIMFKGAFLNNFLDLSLHIFMQFPSVYLLIVILGIFAFFKKWGLSRASLSLLICFLINTGFFMSYNTWDKFQFLLPSFLILFFWSAFGIEFISDFLKKHRLFLLRTLLAITLFFSFFFTIYFYKELTIWGDNPRSFWYKLYNDNYARNLYRINSFVANPDKRNFQEFKNACFLLFDKLPKYSIFFDSDSRTYYQLTLYYQKYYHKRLDLNIQLVNSFGFDNWGNSKTCFEKILEDAYNQNKNLFLISLGHPFSNYLSALKKTNTYHFSKYPLDSQRWVYKLITSKETVIVERKPSDISAALNSTKRAMIDLCLEDVLYTNQGNLLFQIDMFNYGELWANGDQVFFSAKKADAEIGFLLKMSQEAKVRLKISLTTADDYGIVDIYLNKKRINDNPVDLFSKNVFRKVIEFNKITLEKGNNTLSFNIIGKNWRSKGMICGIDTLEFLSDGS